MERSATPAHLVDGLEIPASVLRRVLAHLRSVSPVEGVGLLAVADNDAGHPGWRRIVAFYPGTNTVASATRYTMDIHEVVVAFRDMRAAGWRLGAIVHSHPGGPPTPSPTDIAEAYYPDAAMMIVSLAGPAPVTRVWSARPDAPGDQIRELGLRVVEDG